MADVFRIQGTYELQDRVTEQLENVQKKVKTTTDELGKSEGKWSSFSEKLSKSGKLFSDVGKKMTTFVTVPLAGLGAMTSKFASDLEQTQRKTQVIFGDMAKDVQNWASENERNFGLGSGTIEKYTGEIADITQGMQMSKEASLEMSKSTVDLGVKLANWGGTNATETMEDLKRAITGSHESVEKYGIKLNDATLSQYAMNLGLGDSFSKLTEAEKATVRYQAILGSSQNAVDYWNDGNRSATFYLTEVKEQLTNVGENIGKVLLPHVVNITKKLGDFIAKVSEWTSKNPKATETIVKLAGAIAVVAPTILLLGKGMMFVSSVMALFTPVATGAAAATTAVGTATTVATAPIWLIIGAIALFVAGILYLWKTNEGFRTAIMNIWDRIKFIIENVCNGIKVFWDTWGTEITGIWNWLWDSIGGVLTNAINVITGILDFFVALFTGNWEGMKTAIMNIAESLVLGLLSMFGLSFDSLTDAAQYFSNVFTGIWDGILGGVKWVVNGIIDGINWAIKGINSLCSMDFPDVVNDFGIPDFNLNIPTVPKWYSEGAIFTQRTILQNGSIGVGDADNGKGDNPEAILPIDKLRGMIQDLLQVNIQMLIDGKEFVSEVVAPHQNQLNNYNQKRNIARAY